MARSRNLKPGFFKNELLVEQPFEYRLLFAGLWTLADREGRLEDRPTKIKMEVFPADNIDVNSGLQALHDAGFILRYEVDGRRLISVLAWGKHQNPHHKEPASTLPEPSCMDIKPEALPPCIKEEPETTKPSTATEPETRLGQAPEKPSCEGGVTVLIPDSLNLIPDSKEKALAQRAARFPEFWSEYPVKKGRAEAEAKWRARNLDAIADRIIADVKQRKQRDRQWLAGYAPHGSTYVNGRGWEDEIEDTPGPTTRRGDPMPDYLAGAR